MNKEQAMKASKTGAVAAFISAAFTLLFALYAIFSNSQDSFRIWNDPSIFIDVVLITICGFGMLRYSRLAAIFIFIYFLVSKIYLGIETGEFNGLIVGIIFLYFFGRAIQGTFVYHRIQKAENPDYKPAPKWMYFVGIPVGVLALALVGLGLLTMTGILPSAEVVKGIDMSKKDISLLIDN